MIKQLNIEEIQKILPQRFPFLMIDRVLELKPKEKIIALKNVSVNEEYFMGHFKGNPIMPGVLIIEAMAQASIILFSYGIDSASDKNLNYYLGSTKIRFLHPVKPGDQLEILIEPIKIISNAAIVKTSVKVSGNEVASGQLSFIAKENG